MASRKVRREHPTRSGGWLEGSGLDVTLAQFWLTSLGAGLATYLVVLGVTSLPVISLMPAVVVATLPKAYFARKRAQRLDEVQKAWPDGLRDLLSTVRSGASLPTAIETLASFGPLPLRNAFHGFPVYSRSLGVVPALEMIKSDLADPTSDRVIEVLILAYERGGAVVPEILSDLAEATTRDLWTLEEIRTEALEQKINSRVVFVLPWLVLVAMTARSGAFREFYSSSAGILVAVIGGVMSVVGVIIASRLGSQPSEPRVFADARGAE
jgi:tight adherence protein B